MIRNILGFVPFGFAMCGYLWLSGRKKKVLLIVILLGAATSLGVEVLQGFLPQRDSGPQGCRAVGVDHDPMVATRAGDGFVLADIREAGQVLAGAGRTLDLGQPNNGWIPGKIFIALPDAEKTVMAGEFSLPME